jgi:catechol 2,3-dioxygenase-like lactoylglutathione lyase family enzyme
VEVLGLEHIDLTVSDLSRSTGFYACVLEALGFRRFGHPVGHPSWSNGKFTLTLRPVAPEFAAAEFNRYRVGLHHLAFKVRQRTDVDALYRLLTEKKFVVLDPPAEYPEYGRGYYAVFFQDPDRFKLEAVHFPWGYWARVQSEGHDTRPRSEPVT